MSKMRAGFSRQIKVIVIMALLAVTGAILSVFWLTRRHAANAHVEVPGIDAQGGVSSPDAVLCANASIGQSPKTRTGATHAGFFRPGVVRAHRVQASRPGTETTGTIA